MFKSVYLAGPEVFYPEAQQHGRRMQAVCAEAGFAGLFPLDAEIPATPQGQSLAIYQANRAHIADPHWIYPGQSLTVPR